MTAVYHYINHRVYTDRNLSETQILQRTSSVEAAQVPIQTSLCWLLKSSERLMSPGFLSCPVWCRRTFCYFILVHCSPLCCLEEYMYSQMPFVALLVSPAATSFHTFLWHVGNVDNSWHDDRFLSDSPPLEQPNCFWCMAKLMTKLAETSGTKLRQKWLFLPYYIS